MTYSATGIILKREPWRETGRLYTIYTREAGKLLAVGRGTRRTVSKLAAHLEPYSAADLLLAHGRRTETICGAVLRRSPEPLARDERRHASAAFAAEAFDHFVKWGERDDGLWQLLEDFFSGLGDMTGTLPDLLAGFAWNLMEHLGYRPRLDACASCGREAVFGAALFLPARGIVLCADCRPDERHLAGAVPLTGERDLVTGLAFLEAHLDRPLTSLPIARTLIVTEDAPLFIFHP